MANTQLHYPPNASEGSSSSKLGVFHDMEYQFLYFANCRITVNFDQ